MASGGNKSFGESFPANVVVTNDPDRPTKPAAPRSGAPRPCRTELLGAPALGSTPRPADGARHGGCTPGARTGPGPLRGESVRTPVRPLVRGFKEGFLCGCAASGSWSSWPPLVKPVVSAACRTAATGIAFTPATPSPPVPPLRRRPRRIGKRLHSLRRARPRGSRSRFKNPSERVAISGGPGTFSVLLRIPTASTRSPSRPAMAIRRTTSPRPSP